MKTSLASSSFGIATKLIKTFAEPKIVAIMCSYRTVFANSKKHFFFLRKRRHGASEEMDARKNIFRKARRTEMESSTVLSLSLCESHQFFQPDIRNNVFAFVWVCVLGSVYG